MSTETLLILIGALAGGLVNGLTGFGTGITGLGFWTHAVAPPVAAGLAAACSVIGQIQTLPAIWHSLDPRRLAPFILGGLAGIPAGVLLLAHISVPAFKIGVGIMLIGYCLFWLVTRKKERRAIGGGRAADASVGFVGGVMSGLAGIPGPPLTVWASLKGWVKEERRSVFQGFNTTMTLLALLSYIGSGLLGTSFLWALATALPGTIVGVKTGHWIYRKLDDKGFDIWVHVLLTISGLILIVTSR